MNDVALKAIPFGEKDLLRNFLLRSLLSGTVNLRKKRHLYPNRCLEIQDG